MRPGTVFLERAICSQFAKCRLPVSVFIRVVKLLKLLSRQPRHGVRAHAVSHGVTDDELFRSRPTLSRGQRDYLANRLYHAVVLLGQ